MLPYHPKFRRGGRQDQPLASAVLLAVAVGVIVYLECDPGKTTTEPTEETVGLSLPTENPDEVTPEDSFDADDLVPPATVGSENSGETESPDDNETPHDYF